MVLEPMLKSAHCYGAFTSDLLRAYRRPSAGFHDHGKHPCTDLEPLTTWGDVEDVIIDQEWLASKRLATEVRLSVHSRDPVTRLYLVEEIDFSKIMAPVFSPTSPTFTVSTYGKLVLAVAGGDISVYSLCGLENSVVPVVRLAAGIPVLKVCMDTSSDRYSVAALLAGRIGMFWNIQDSHINHIRYRSNSGEASRLGMQAEIQSSSGSHGTRFGSLPVRQAEVASSSDTDGGKDTSIAQPVLFYHDDTPTESPEELDAEINATPCAQDYTPTFGIPIETRAHAIYTNLGSTNDPPRSVAICPDRTCCAFGCRMGIELHWIDTLSGNDLSRWFPLAAPSDHLYFLPQRPGIDSPRKLRLISSAAGVVPKMERSDSSPTKLKRWLTPATFGRRKSLTRFFYGDVPFPSPIDDSGSVSGPQSPQERQGVLRTVDCDHFHAIPVSDGMHLVFTDPITGMVCLGSDAPLGEASKLQRKVVFVPPSKETPYPLCYAVGAALD
jgi:hypothetical protein